MLTALGLGLRIYRLGHDPLWFDEAFTALTAHKPIAEIFTALKAELSAPLYYLMLHGWERIVGDSDFALRLLSALTGAAVVPALYAVGSALFSPGAGLVAAALGAIGPLHVHHSQELRMYGLLPLAALGALYGFVAVVRDGERRGALILALSLALGFYLHYFVFFLLPLSAAALWSRTPRSALALMGLALGAAGLAFLPWSATLLGQTAEPHAPDWMAEWWARRPLSLAIPWSLMVIGPGAVYPPGWFKLGSSTVAAAVSVLFAATTLSCAVVRFRSHPRFEDRIVLALTAAAIFSPLVCAFVISVVRSPIYVVGRYDEIAWAPYLLLTAAMLSELPRVVGAIAIVLWIGVAGTTLVPHFLSDRPILTNGNAGHVYAEKLGRQAQPGDLVVFAGSTRPTTEHYLAQWGERLRLVSYPLGTDEHLGWTDVRVATDGLFAESEARRLTTWVAALDPTPKRIWLVAPFTAGNGPVVAQIKALGYTVDTSRSDRQVMLFLKQS